MTWDWVAFTNTCVAALFGTGFGALVAFWIEDRKRKERLEDARVEATNVAIFALSRAFRDVESFRRERIQPVRDSTLRWYTMVAGEFNAPAPAFDASALAFLFETDKPDLPSLVQLDLDRYASVRAAIRDRYVVHTAQLQLRLERFDRAQASEQELEEMAGPRLHQTLRRLTDNIVTAVDELVPSLRAVALELRSAVRAVYPGRQIIRFEPIAPGALPVVASPAYAESTSVPLRGGRVFDRRRFHMSADSVYGLANWVLIGALLLGVVATYAIVKSGKIRDDILRTQLATQTERAALLSKQAEELKLDVAHAAERAAEAELALEKFKAPRTMTSQQQEQFRESLMPYAGRAIDMFLYGETTDTVGLSQLLTILLSKSGWHCRIWTVTGGGAVSGVLVVTRPGGGATFEEAAAALVAALKTADVSAEKIAVPSAWPDWVTPIGLLNGPNWDTNRLASIRLLIGAKPP